MLTGSCHCGAVRFRVDWAIEELTTCDCSLRVKGNALMAKVPEAALTVLEGEASLRLYTWNTGRTKHYFCQRCGIYALHRKDRHLTTLTSMSFAWKVSIRRRFLFAPPRAPTCQSRIWLPDPPSQVREQAPVAPVLGGHTVRSRLLSFPM